MHESLISHLGKKRKLNHTSSGIHQFAAPAAGPPTSLNSLEEINCVQNLAQPAYMPGMATIYKQINKLVTVKEISTRFTIYLYENDLSGNLYLLIYCVLGVVAGVKEAPSNISTNTRNNIYDLYNASQDSSGGVFANPSTKAKVSSIGNAADNQRLGLKRKQEIDCYESLSNSTLIGNRIGAVVAPIAHQQPTPNVPKNWNHGGCDINNSIILNGAHGAAATLNNAHQSSHANCNALNSGRHHHKSNANNSSKKSGSGNTEGEYQLIKVYN